MGYRELSTKTLMSMRKADIIEHLRVAEHNFRAMEQTVEQQYQNTKDWMPVVRCKDCKHRESYECNHISLGETQLGVSDDWFCADGERKQDDERH